MVMTGTIYKSGDKWRVSYWDGPIGNQDLKHIDIHQDSLDEFGWQLEDPERFLAIATNVEFEIVKKFLAKETLWLAKLKPKKKSNDSIKDNKIEQLQEDIECVHMYLDDKKIPREDENGETYSIVGRIKRLEFSLSSGAKYL